MCFKGKVLPKSALLKKEMEPGEVDAAANLVAKEFPKKSDKFIQYGTAGFRTKYMIYQPNECSGKLLLVRSVFQIVMASRCVVDCNNLSACALDIC